MKKIKWGNVIDLFVLIMCFVIIIHDIVMLMRGWSFTWFGLATLFLAIFGADVIIEDFKDQLKSTSKKKY